MAFFLIGKSPGNDLRLLSPSLFATRQDAMAELSRLSSDSEFPHWDADVSVIDLDAGVPVLLVRPQVAAGPAAAAQAPTAETPAEPVAAEPTPIAEYSASREFDVSEFDLAPAEPIAEAIPEASQADEPAPDVEALAPAESPEEATETASEPVEDEPSEAVSADDLRTALQRTAEQMSAEGITPPPSAGLSWAPIAIGEALTAAGITTSAAAEERASAPQPAEEPAPAGEPEPAAEPAAAAPQPEAAPEAPEPDAAPEAAPEPEPEAAPEQPAYSSAPSWPWASAAPAATESEPAAELSESEAQTVYSGATTPASGAHEPMSAVDAQAEASPAEPDSDFILDLDAIQPVAIAEPSLDASETEPETAAAVEEPAAPVSIPLTEYTCDDCVYVATCPNRDHRLPKDCGSFQWK